MSLSTFNSLLANKHWDSAVNIYIYIHTHTIATGESSYINFVDLWILAGLYFINKRQCKTYRWKGGLGCSDK